MYLEYSEERFVDVQDPNGNQYTTECFFVCYLAGARCQQPNSWLGRRDLDSSPLSQEGEGQGFGNIPSNAQKAKYTMSVKS